MVRTGLTDIVTGLTDRRPSEIFDSDGVDKSYDMTSLDYSYGTLISYGKITCEKDATCATHRLHRSARPSSYGIDAPLLYRCFESDEAGAAFSISTALSEG